MRELDQAIRIACDVHDGKHDLGGEEYILHPLRVMFSFDKHQKNERIVAVLHDTIEDSKGGIREQLVKLIWCGIFPQEVVDAVFAITKNNGENYFEYIDRVSKNDLAKKVKIADIKDNLDTSRLNVIKETDLNRIEKYKKALKILESM